MFAAAAIVAKMAFDAALEAAKWLATKAIMISLIMVVLPWVLKGFFIYCFDFLLTYGKEIAQYMMTALSSATTSAGIHEISVPLQGIGGYLAIQTGFVDYCTIIFTGWGVYWFVCLFPRSILARV